MHQIIASLCQKKEKLAQQEGTEAAGTPEHLVVFREQGKNRDSPATEEVHIVAAAAESQNFWLEKSGLTVLDKLADYFLGSARTQMINDMKNSIGRFHNLRELCLLFFSSGQIIFLRLG